MLYISNQNTDAAFNLALEEYLLTDKTEDIFMLWRNERAIVVGINQNTISEINIEKVREKNVKVIRRLTGGGAVFHDLGNINYTFITKDGAFGDYSVYLEPVIKALQALGVNAEFSGRNDMTVNGMKISGNAQCVKNGRFLQHGTILFSADMSDLTDTLNVNPLKIQDKGVKSIRSRVTNIALYLKEQMTAVEFFAYLEKFILAEYGDITAHNLTEGEMKGIEEIKRERYDTWEWNYGQSPAYTYKNAAYINGMVEVYLNVADGTVQNAKIYGDFFSKKDIKELENALNNVRHEKFSIEERLKDIDISQYISGIEGDEFINILIG